MSSTLREDCPDQDAERQRNAVETLSLSFFLLHAMYRIPSVHFSSSSHNGIVLNWLLMQEDDPLSLLVSSSPVAAVKFTINNQPPLNHESKHIRYLILVVAVENILISALALIFPLSPLEVLEGKQSDTAQFSFGKNPQCCAIY